MPAPTPPLSQAPAETDRLLRDAVQQRASDIHLEPTARGYDVRYRTDGLLQSQRQFDRDLGRSVVTRLMVMAELLTYRHDVPQEGRLTFSMPTAGEGECDATSSGAAVSSMPH